MLAFIEKHLSAMRAARSEADLTVVLDDLCRALGFRSAYLVETPVGAGAYILDTRPERAPWWREYSAARAGNARPEVTEVLNRGGVQYIDSEALYAPDDPMREIAKKFDMLQSVLVPVTHGGMVVGVAGFSGQPQLTDANRMALQVIVYSLFARVHDLRSAAAVSPAGALTPREREVITLSASGLTSQEIAERLGMSARTVNQHVDNVAAKLGTKNRAHTVAEAIRHHLLH